MLTSRFGIHPRAAGDCAKRNPVPKVHLYRDHLFVVLHGPERGARGHVHYVELDQFIGPGWYITVHGPLNPKVAPEAARVETGAVTRRLLDGRFRPTTAHELSFAVVAALTARLRDYLTALTEEVWTLERQVTAGHHGDAEEFLEELFQVRHGLLAVRTMAALSREVYGRMAALPAVGDGPRPAARGRRGPVPAHRADGRRAARVPAGRDRVLPDPHQHEDDDRGRAPRRDRRGDAAR